MILTTTRRSWKLLEVYEVGNWQLYPISWLRNCSPIGPYLTDGRDEEELIGALKYWFQRKYIVDL